MTTTPDAKDAQLRLGYSERPETLENIFTPISFCDVTEGIDHTFLSIDQLSLIVGFQAPAPQWPMIFLQGPQNQPPIENRSLGRIFRVSGKRTWWISVDRIPCGSDLQAECASFLVENCKEGEHIERFYGTCKTKRGDSQRERETVRHT